MIRVDDFEGVELMIGLNYEESEQRTGNHGNKAFVKYNYPLVDKKFSRQTCIHLLKQIGLYPKFPAYMKRGGCVGCYYKSVKEYEAMALLNPEEFKIVRDLENDIQDQREDFFSIRPEKTMDQIKENVSNLLFKPEEIYPTLNDATKCGVFCNRWAE